ncbi:MAG: LPS export ABC transporter protein LptC [Lysobacterales bacterium]|jgi:LPS export ABC transporter protein LptC
MIQRKTQWGILVLSVLVATSFWASRGQKDRSVQPTRGLDTKLDFALQDFEYQFFDVEGQPSFSLIAPTLSNNASTGISEVQHPVFNFIDQENSWEIVAESATVSADKEHILLNGDVHIRRPATGMADSLDISTAELMIDVGPKTASSKMPVHMIEGNNIMEAVGFRVNMKSNRFQLQNKVKLTYAVIP